MTDIKYVSKVLRSIIFGVAVGDAVGVPYEFKIRSLLCANPCTDMIGYGTHSQPEGTWSDDTSLTLCLLDGMSIRNHTLNITQVATNMIEWCKYGEFSACYECFDIGGTTSDAISRMESSPNYVECGGVSESDNGNGSLMRIAPMSIYLLDEEDADVRYNITANISSLTHRHEISCVACYIYEELLRLICIDVLAGEVREKGEYLEEISTIGERETDGEKWSKRYPQFELIWSNRVAEIEEDEVRSGGYVVDSLIASIWSFMQADNYRDGILTAVNLGNDTDTTAAIAGGLLSGYYGYEDIPKSWVIKLQNKTLINQTITKALG